MNYIRLNIVPPSYVTAQLVRFIRKMRSTFAVTLQVANEGDDLTSFHRNKSNQFGCYSLLYSFIDDS